MNKKTNNRARIVGLENLSEEEKEAVELFCEKELKRLDDKYHKIASFSLKVKSLHHYNAKNKKYSLVLYLKLENKNFEADYADWSLTTALKKVIERVEIEIEHKLHLIDKKHIAKHKG